MKSVLMFLTCLMALAMPVLGGKVAPQNVSRVDEIAAWLPEKPSAGGWRISDRAMWDRLAKFNGAADIMRAAVELLEKPVPECSDERYLDFTRNGNRTRYQEPYFDRTSNLQKLVLAECFENNGRFLPKISEYLEVICGERSWVMPAHDRQLLVFEHKMLYVDLGSGDRTWVLAAVIDWLGEKLDSALVKRVKDEAWKRTFEPYLLSARGLASKELNVNHWWYGAEMNWNSVCNCTCVRAALAMVDDRRVRAEFVESAERTMVEALKGYTDDGYCSEGIGYWNYGWGHQLRLGLAVREATGGKVDLFKDPKCRKVMEYGYAFQIEDGRSPQFADGGGNPGGLLLRTARRVWPDLDCTAAREANIFAGANLSGLAMQDLDGDKAATEMYVLPKTSQFPCAQVYVMRMVAGKHHYGVAVKGGHNDELHNHNDLGSYYLMFDGLMVSGDPGGEIYTAKTFGSQRYTSPVLGSYGHPVPLVAGQEQKPGRKFAAMVLDTSFADDCDKVVIDIKGGYDVKELEALTRTFEFNRTERTFKITDKVKFSVPCKYENPMVTYLGVESDYEKGVFNLVKKGKKKCRVKFDAKGGEWKTRGELVFNPQLDSSKRVALEFVEPVSEAETTLTFKW